MSSLADLQRVLDGEIPMCAQMGIRVTPHDELPIDVAATGGDELWMRMPLERNRNHQQTAFAGSLNALCTIAGWGATYLELRRRGLEGVIVIRRSAIKYHEPVTAPLILARCPPPAEDARQFFAEMLVDKGQAKLDLSVEIAGRGGPAVSFSGSYVVMPPDGDAAD